MQAQEVQSLFGYWPEFADGRIVLFSYERGRAIVMGIYYIDAEQAKGALITLKFSDASDVELSDLLTENVVDALRISDTSPMAVEIEACYGLRGTFKCKSVEVLSVLPNIPV